MADLKSKSGFTLIEVMIAMAVLMIGMLALISLQMAGIRQLAQAKQRTAATQLATQTLEYLKTVPVDPNDRSRIFTDAVTGANLVDAAGVALLDDTSTDGKLTWHLLRPYGEDGIPMAAGSNWTSQSLYLVAYGVDWGGANGNHFVSAGGETNELLLAQYPEILPGANQIYLEVWVGWIEPGARLQTYEGAELRNALEYFNVVGDTFPNNPAVFTRRKIALKTLRQL